MLIRALRPGGLLCYRTFDVRERDRSGRPRSDKHLLQPEELVALVDGLKVLDHGTRPDTRGRLQQGILARKPRGA